MSKKILIIEDDNEINRMLKILLESNSYTTASAYSGTMSAIHDIEKAQSYCNS